MDTGVMLNTAGTMRTARATLDDAGIAPPELARGLGWFSIALGTMELLAPRAITRFLGMRGHEGLVRAYGLREIGVGIGVLQAKDPGPWVWGRVGGDALDLLTVAPGLAGRRPGRALFALATLAAVTAVDVLCAAALDEGKT